MAPAIPKFRPKPLTAAANLANLLPTGTVLAFQALESSFSNNGKCLPANRYLTFSMIVICSIVCFLSSFTDSFTSENGKLYYGIATPKGLYILNRDDESDSDDEDDKEKGNKTEKAVDEREDDDTKNLKKYGIGFRDFVHAFSSVLVILVFATSNSDVQSCFFPHSGANGNQLMMNLPLGVGALASFLFMVLPTQRRGIGYADNTARTCKNCHSRV